MIYNNLLTFLTAIFIFSMATVPAHTMLAPVPALLLFIFGLLLYDRLAAYLFRPNKINCSTDYFKTEKKISILAILFFSATLYFCDAKYYLLILSFNGHVPAFANIAGLALFLFYLAMSWRVSKTAYQQIFNREIKTSTFIISNIRTNLPIVLPWVALSLASDIFTLLPFPAVHRILESEWGDLIFFAIFLLLILIFFPPLVRRLWGCRPLADGQLKSDLTAFCAKQNFSADIFIWPLFEGRVLTAGVMGIVPGFRYILLTPAIIETMDMSELEAVMAHEIGHVKRFHMLLYLFLVVGFSITAGFFAEPFTYFILSSSFFYSMLEVTNGSPELLLTLTGAVPLLLLMLFYFRYVFGYFIRNFERQADLHVFTVFGHCDSLISAFEKIAVISGNRDEPSWHHFGIGERIDYLLKCDNDRNWIRRHNQKVYASLTVFIVIMGLAIGLVRQLPVEAMAKEYEDRYADAVLMQKIKDVPNKALWLRLAGDMMQGKKLERKALLAYRKALELEPANPEVLNNLAWLLLTCDDRTLRNPLEGMTLAQTAAILTPQGYILDTLATAYWSNGLVEEAVETEQRAIRADPGKRTYYRSQIEKFIHHKYDAGDEKEVENL